MISLLRAIFDALRRVLEGQSDASEKAAADLAELNARLGAAADRAAELQAAIEHLRVLVEDDGLIAVVGRPTFTSQE